MSQNSKDLKKPTINFSVALSATILFLVVFSIPILGLPSLGSLLFETIATYHLGI